MATTTKTVPYPVGADNNNMHTHLQNLAQWVDDSLGPFTTTARDALSASLKWNGRLIFNSTTRRLEQWDSTYNEWQVPGCPGEVRMWSGATAPPGWLLMGANVAGANVTYPILFAILPAGYKTSTDIVWDTRGRSPMGAGDGASPVDLTARTLGAFLGEENHSLTSAENGTHTHVQDSHNHTQNSHNHTQDAHNHSQNPHNHNQDPHGHPGPGGVYEYVTQWPGGGANAFQLLAGPNAILNSGSIPAATATNQAASGSNNAATATNQATTATNNAQTATNQNSGSGTPHNVIHPVFTINYIIKY